MTVLLLKASLLFLYFSGFVEANLPDVPRMIFTDKDTAVKRIPFPTHHAPVWTFLEEESDTVTAIGQKNLNSFNFQNPMKAPEERKVLWSECDVDDCNYSTNVVHRRVEANQVFLCGASSGVVLCCDMNLSGQTPMCTSSNKTRPIQESIIGCNIKEGEPSALVESGKSAALYVTRSGSDRNVGIHKFGENRVRPPNHHKEQYYVNLMPTSQTGDDTQDKVYAFYKEKNKDTTLGSEMWLPFVTHICMSDLGGPKNNLQFTWTSQMNARLFCGDPDRRQHFSELVDVATVQAERWQDTKVYALFRNEWGMSAVCVYTMHDIEDIFASSPFKDNGNHKTRPRVCVEDSRKIALETLKMIEKTQEMEQWVRPQNNSAPCLLNHHNYTHIYVDSSQHQGNNDHIVLFLSLDNGRIHKVMYTKNQTLVIAEYQPFNHQVHIVSMTLDPSTRKLYVRTGHELVQLDVANCANYGDRCEDCVLARDPYCGWNGTHCTPETHNTLQDVTRGNHETCPKPHGKALRYSTVTQTDKAVDSIKLPAKSKYFLQCPVSSHHAQYTWHHQNNSTSCSLKAKECLILINSMGPEQEGTYKCVSLEMGYSKVLAEYDLQMENRAVGRLLSPQLWVCLMAVLFKSL